MAYRIEKEPNGGNVIIIDGWADGIAPDPYSGINRMLAVNLEVPGEVSVGYPITASTTSGGTLGVPIADSTRYFPTYVTQGTGTGSAQSYAILDASGQVWEATTISGTWTFLSSSNSTTGSSNLDGIAYWNGYLFKFRNNAIDIWNGSSWYKVGWNPTTGGTGGTPITAGVQHFAYVATNNNLYFTNGNFIGRIFAANPAAFDPATPSTYDFNAQILGIPTADTAISLAEVGGGSTPQSTLLIGGSFNAIYPWDKISTSFSLPIYVADGYIKRMVSANQNAFIFPGNTGGRGRIYITNGSQAELYYKVPDYLFNVNDPYFEWGDAIFHRNNLIFGFFAIPNSQASPVLSSYIWALNLDTKAFRSISEISSPSGIASPGVLIAAVNPSGPGFSYITGWSDGSGGSNRGIGYSGTAAGINALGFNIQTDKIPVGTFLQKFTPSQIEFKLRSPLQSGESITITPIVDDSVQTAITFSPTVTTGSISGVGPITFTGSQWLQLQVAGIGNSASSGVRLYEIRIR